MTKYPNKVTIMAFPSSKFQHIYHSFSHLNQKTDGKKKVEQPFGAIMKKI